MLFVEPGPFNVACFTDMARIRDRIITDATNLIKNEIKCIQYKTNVYPLKADIEFLEKSWWEF